MKYRKPVLVLNKPVKITKDAHCKLRALKKLKKESMAQIVIDLIDELYNKEKSIQAGEE